MARLTIVRHDTADPGRDRARRISLHLDGHAWCRLTEPELAELGLHDDDEIDEERRLGLELILARTRARLFAVRSLAARAQSEAELRKKLAAREIPGAIIDETIELAHGYRYLDDAELAGQLARGFLGRGYGRRRAGQGLTARLIPRELADRALDEAFGGADEAELARAALGLRFLGGDDAGRRKAAAFLARRGYSSAVAWQVIRERERTS